MLEAKYTEMMLNKTSISLRDRVAIITGANRGIGRAILDLFAENGANLILCTRAKDIKFEEYCRNKTIECNITIDHVYFDMENSHEIKSAAMEIVALKKKIAILVNNAGVASGSLLHMTSIESMRKVFEVNFFGPIIFTQIISRYMLRFKEGSIINVGSTAGLIGSEGTLSYGGSKAALMHATKVLSNELGPYGIRVNAIAPSVTKTDMFSQMDPLAREALIMSGAIKRAAEPTEVAQAALFLASDMSTFITGQTLRVDGGIS